MESRFIAGCSIWDTLPRLLQITLVNGISKEHGMTRYSPGLIAIVGVAAMLAGVSTASAQTAPSLGTAQSYAVLGGSTVTNTGPSVVTGDLGLSPGGAITGFPPGQVIGGTIHAADAAAASAQNSTTTAYNTLAGQACPGGNNLTGQNLGGLTLTPGVYCFNSSAQLTGALTLNAQGNAAAVFVFQIGSALTTASASSVVMSNGGSACNVFWQVGSSATLGTTSSFAGNLIALSSVTATTSASVTGRILARNGAATLDTNAVNASACGGATATPVPAPAPTPAPTSCTATAPDLFIVKRHTTAFVAGTNATYSIALFNQGIASTTAVTVVDTLPTGLTYVSATGVSWTCSAVGQIVTCTTTASVPAAAPFPNNITLTVTPGANAVPSVTNTAAVSGGADCDLTNNSTADITLVTAAPPPIPVPTLPEWAFAALAVLLAGVGVVALRRRAI
jgi:uncharacterized repeat protein (TIGR01451 family)